MMDFFQNIFGKVISLMASVIIAVGLVSVPKIPEQHPTTESRAEVVIEKIENQKTETEKPNEVIKTTNQETQNQDGSEQDEKIEILRAEIKNLESYLREHYDYVPRVRIEQNETLVDFLERQKRVYEETIEKARKIENEVEALNRSLVEGDLIQKQIACLEKETLLQKIKDLPKRDETTDTLKYYEEQYLKAEKLCNE